MEKYENGEHGQDYTAAAMATPDTAEAALPRFEGAEFQQLRVPSIQGKRHYRVDLVNYTCTCPEFPGRLDYPVSSRHRACPHIKVAVEQHCPGFFDSALRRELASMANHAGAAITWFDGDQNIAIAHATGSAWCDVFMIANYRYERFGYSIDERRWSYHQAPPQAEDIAAFIHASIAAPVDKRITSDLKGGFWRSILRLLLGR